MKQAVAIILLLIVGELNAQLVTNNNRSANDLVRNVLAGEGVQISNVQYTGHATAIGEFFGASSNIGLAHGILLSSGSVLNTKDALNRQNGPVGPNNNSQGSSRFGLPGDPDLSSLVGGSKSHDAAVLEFDFIPEGDTVRFRYVFASEEYPEWVNTANNDAFGFFISGAGFTGKKNIALLPDGTTAVSINNVNAGKNNVGPGKNESYFINNGGGTEGSPQYTDPKAVNYDGFTVVLEAVARVQPCQTYHLKIVIGDVQDDHMDSGVFLEANSLNSVPKFSINQDVDYAPNSSKVEIFEGCSKGELTIKRSNKLFETLVVPFKIYGSAINGTDYDAIPASITFMAGETSKKITINPIRDALNEGVETVLLRFKNPSVCESDSIDVEYQINDQPPLLSTTTNIQVTCAGDEVQIGASVSGGVPSYNYVWEVGGNESQVTVAPNGSSFYSYVATDACGQQVEDSVQVLVPTYPIVELQSINDTSVRCPGSTFETLAIGKGGAGGYRYLWSTGHVGASVDVVITNTQSLSVEVTDQCGSSANESFMVTLNYPEFSAQVGSDTIVCKGDEIEMFGVTTGGIPPYRYYWSGVEQNPYLYVAEENKSLLFSAYDSCGIVPAEAIRTVNVQQPIADFEINASIPEPNEEIIYLNNSKYAVSFDWDLGNGENSTVKNASTTYSDIKNYNITLAVKDELGCQDLITKTLVLRHPFYFYLPNSFTPNADGKNDEYLCKQIGATDFTMQIFNKWGELLFSSNDYNKGWDGTFNGKKLPMEVYIVQCVVKSIYREDKEYKFAQTVTLVR